MGEFVLGGFIVPLQPGIIDLFALGPPQEKAYLTRFLRLAIGYGIH
jgi:hypothetical protein